MNLFLRSLTAGISIAVLTACNGGSSSGGDDSPAVQWTVSATAGVGGSVSAPVQKIDDGQVATLTVAPDSGYQVVEVTGCGGSLVGTTYTTAPITADCAISASFEVIPDVIYTVSATAGAGGSFDTTTQNVQAGNTASFTLTPDAGFGIDTVSGCDGTLNGNVYTTGVIAANCTVTATFVAQYTITGGTVVGGTIDPASRTVNAGATASFMVVPDSGYILDNVTGCGGTLNGLTYTTGPAAADCTFNATFIELHTVTINAGPNGNVTPGTQTLPHGDALELTVSPAPGYVVDQVQGCGIAKVGPYYWETSPVTADCTVDIGFRASADIFAGGFHTCSKFDTLGSIANKCWGFNISGQLGTGSFTPVVYGDEPGETPSAGSPLTLPMGLGVGTLELGTLHSCAILSDAQAYCWGENGDGQLGNGTTNDANAMSVPVDLGGKGVMEVQAGGAFTCARMDDNSVRCWGLNTSGELGDGTTNSTTLPAVNGPTFSSRVLQLAAGAASACARLQNNEVYCWGDNSSGQLGDSDGGNDSATPAQVNLGGATVTDLAAGGLFACAIANSQVRCWGENGSGQLGNNDNTNTDLDVPTAPLNLGGQIPLKLALGGEHGCVLTTIGTVHCWGESDAGQTGQNDTTDDIAPIEVPLGINYTTHTVADIAAGNDHTCVVLQPVDPLDTTRPVRCWGEGGFGQLGLEGTDDIGDNEVVDNVLFNVDL